MTNREFYINVLNLVNTLTSDEPADCVDAEAISVKASELLAKLDAQNEKRRNAERKPTPKQIAAAEYDAKLMEAIDGILTDEFQPRTAFAEVLDVSPSKASHLLNKMVANGAVLKGDFKGEKGKQVGYKRA